ncbi:MAG: NAD(P)H-dependent oxidoreductase subunit E [Anaerolineae bacterium]|jgi:NADH:ubiquinone oxidoreductase subunit E|nr:NAD(P)H-dependent oxidoreductase subunit E [Anaerolineae bacterium]
MEKTQMMQQVDVIPMVQETVEKYHANRTELVTMLHELTRKIGYLPPEVFPELARLLDVSVGEIYSVTTFYTMLLTNPRGKHLVQFCESAPCHLAGGNQLLKMLEEVLGITAGETSENGLWTLIKTSCLGRCGEGPILVVDDEVYSEVTREKLWAILAKYEQGGVQ